MVGVNFVRMRVKLDMRLKSLVKRVIKLVKMPLIRRKMMK